MIEKTCDLWLETAEYRCILTSGAVSNGEAVFDTRSAREANAKFAGLSTDLARLLSQRGNHVHELRPGLLAFPIKQFQWSGPTLQVIERSGRELLEMVGERKTLLPRPGCGPNQLKWEDVSQALSFLPDNIIITDWA